MLRWRIVLGAAIIASLVGLTWLDARAAVPGVWLLPVAVFFALAASREVLDLAEAGGLQPLRWAVVIGNLLLVLSNWVAVACRSVGQPPAKGETVASTPQLPEAAWVLFALGLGLLLVLIGEMRRYEKPGKVLENVAVAVFALVYVGVLLSFAIQLRMTAGWGVAGLASLIIVAKMGDTGAYTAGRLFGRHKLAPILSPGKTLEGAAGALAFGCLGAWVTFRWLVTDGSRTSWWGWLVFGLAVAAAGIVGDLAESLVKRDVGRKDSSTWLPGFGGVLDILDSILVAAPVAWLCWALGLVGR